MAEISFRDWFPPLVAALSGGTIGALVGSVGGYLFNSRLNVHAREAASQVRRKQELYQPLYRHLTVLRDNLDPQQNPYLPYEVNLEPERESVGANFNLWTQLKRDGRDVEISADIATKLDSLEQSALGYNDRYQQVRGRWLQDVRALAFDLRRIPTDAFNCDAVIDLLNCVVLKTGDVNEVVSFDMQMTLGHHVAASEVLQHLDPQGSDWQSVQSAWEKLLEDSEGTRSALADKIRHITNKFEGG